MQWYGTDASMKNGFFVQHSTMTFVCSIHHHNFLVSKLEHQISPACASIKRTTQCPKNILQFLLKNNKAVMIIMLAWWCLHLSLLFPFMHTAPLSLQRSSTSSADSHPSLHICKEGNTKKLILLIHIHIYIHTYRQRDRCYLQATWQ